MCRSTNALFLCGIQFSDDCFGGSTVRGEKHLGGSGGLELLGEDGDGGRAEYQGYEKCLPYCQFSVVIIHGAYGVLICPQRESSRDDPVVKDNRYDLGQIDSAVSRKWHTLA